MALPRAAAGPIPSLPLGVGEPAAIAPRWRAVPAVAAPSPGSGPGMASGPQSPSWSVMSEVRGFLVTFKNKLFVCYDKTVCFPLPQRELLSWVCVVPLALSSACESKIKRLGHQLLSSMPVELCL